MKNKSFLFVFFVLIISYLYSGIYLLFPLKKLNEFCIFQNKTPYGEMCVLNLAIIVVSFYMFIPLIVGFILQKFFYKESLKNIGFRLNFNYWYIFAWIFPVTFAWLTLFVATFIPGVEFDPGATGFIEKYKNVMEQNQLDILKKQMENNVFNPFLSTIQMLIAGLTINTFFALGEEFGWRGFLLKSLENKKFFVKTLIIGFIWGIWHFPVVIQGHNYPKNPVFGILMMVIWCILLTPFFNYVTVKTNSFFPAAIMHGTINSSAGYSILYLKGGNDLLIGMTGISGFMVLLIFNIMLCLYDKFFAKEKVIFIT